MLLIAGVDFRGSQKTLPALINQSPNQTQAEKQYCIQWSLIQVSVLGGSGVVPVEAISRNRQEVGLKW